MLFSSHILSEVSAVCDQVLIIDGGRLIAEDTPENLSKKMHGGITLVMEIGGRRAAVKKALAQVGKVRVHTVVESGENAVTATLEIEDDAARDDIFFVLAKAGCPIRNTTEQTASLEEISASDRQCGPGRFRFGRSPARTNLAPGDRRG